MTESDWQHTNCYTTALRRAERAINRIYDNALRPVGVTTAQYSLLSLIERAPVGIALSELAQAQVMDRTTLSRNLTTLERDGLVAIEHGDDRRVRSVSLTEQGHETIRTCRPLWRAAQDRIASEHGLGRMSDLMSVLGELSKTAD